MPAKSEAQRKAAGTALAAKRGDMSPDDLYGAAKEMYNSMTEKELEDFAKKEDINNIISDMALLLSEDPNEGFIAEDWPKDLEKGRFTEYCKEQGFEGPCIECAEKAMESDSESVRGMAAFYMNTVKPKGKDLGDIDTDEED